jgi:hypothetical protein
MPRSPETDIAAGTASDRLTRGWCVLTIIMFSAISWTLIVGAWRVL